VSATPTKRDYARQRRVAIGSLIAGTVIVIACAVAVRVWPDLRSAVQAATKVSFLIGLATLPLAAIARRVFPGTAWWMILVTTVAVALVLTAAVAFAFLARPAV